MGKYSIGSKFIIEIEEILKDSKGKNVYKMKDFNCLTFDDNGLKRLEQVKAKYEAGEEIEYKVQYDGKIRKAIVLIDKDDFIPVIAEKDGKYIVSNGISVICVDTIIRKTGKIVDLELCNRS